MNDSCKYFVTILTSNEINNCNLFLVGDFNATQTAPAGAASNQKGQVRKWISKLNKPVD